MKPNAMKSAMWLPMALTVVVLAGCANVAEKLRSQPVAHFRAGDSSGNPMTIGNNVTNGPQIRFYCMDPADGEVSGDGRRTGATGNCSYASANYSDIVNFKSADPVEVDRALDALLSMSDINCSNYMHRVFSNRALTDVGGKLSEDLLTSASTAVAHIDPTASAALGVANLVVGKSMDTFNSTYFLDKTFQALEAAISGERQRIRATVLVKRNLSRQAPKDGMARKAYGPVEALSDLRAYDDACSFKAGLNILVSLAEREQTALNRQVMRLTVAENPTQEARCLYSGADGTEKCAAAADASPGRGL